MHLNFSIIYTSYSTYNVFRAVSNAFKVNFGSSNEGGTHVHKFYKTERDIPFHQLDSCSCCQCTELLSEDKQTIKLGFAFYSTANGFKDS
jgi:hypothetical protein